ncbi:MAG TPA: hypothetical protein VKU41_15995 [Polyangiaceae bacterium]|nr:hypothetical protein [Polyangiaceae bacterium]
MSQRPNCIDCGATAPETNTNYTLISTSFGWRLTRQTQPGGSVTVEWRCATCWRKHKAKSQVPAALPRNARRVANGGSVSSKGSSSTPPPAG